MRGLSAILFLLLGMGPGVSTAQRLDVCYLSDMSSDVDDLGALQLLAYYHKTGAINLRCVILGTSGSNNHLVVKHFLGYWGISGVAIGNNHNGNGYSFTNDSKWVNHYLNVYPTTGFQPENGATLLNRMLNLYPALRVIEVGPPVTTYNARAIGRIKKYYQMGGEYREGHEYNLRTVPAASQYIASGNVEWYDNKLGRSICTGSSSHFPYNTPVKTGYQKYTGGGCRPSWDLTAVVGMVEPKYYAFRSGRMILHANGANSWSDIGTQRVAFARDTGLLKARIVDILGKRPQDVKSGREVNLAPILLLLLGGLSWISFPLA